METEGSSRKTVSSSQPESEGASAAGHVSSSKYGGLENGSSSPDMFTFLSSEMDRAMMRFSIQPVSELLVVQRCSPRFEEVLRMHGFGGRQVVLRSTMPAEESSDKEGQSNAGGLNWIPTNDGKKVFHADILLDPAFEERTVEEHGVRPLPVLLTKVDSLCSPENGEYGVWLVAQDAYLNKCPPRNGVWLWFPAANTEVLNDDFWEQLGYSRETTPIYPPHQPASWMSVIDKASLTRAINNFSVTEVSAGAVPFDLRVLYHKVNEEPPVCLRCQGSPLVWSVSGKILAMLGCHTDVSAENRDHLTKISFIGKISHEIRTPLNAMCGAFDILSEYMADSPESTQEAWAMLSDATRQVRVVVDDVLDFSALLAGKMRIRKAPEPLHDMLAEAVRLHSGNAYAKSINLSVAPLPAGVPERVMVDRSRIQQVLSNLLSNALKFTPKGGDVSVAVSSVTSHSTSYCTYYHIDVTDTGRGIPRTHWDSVFEDFRQTNHSDSCMGTGLGLAICSMLIGLHGGHIAVHSSQPGKGTTFRIRLETPVLQPPALGSDGTSSCRRPSAPLKTVPLGTVLIVDDMKPNIIVLKAFIKKIDPKAEIITAENGQLAVAMAIDNDVDVVLMDVHMPVLDGIEATKYILAKKPELNVVGFTANTDSETDALCRSVGMKNVLLKPTTRQQLTKTLAMLVHEK